MKYLNQIAVFGYLLLFVQMQAVVFRFDEWLHQKTGQKIYACSDLHQVHHADRHQVDNVVSLLKHNNVHLIIEDYDPSERVLLPLSQSRFLRNLDYVAVNAGINTTCIEFRHHYPWTKTQDLMAQYDEVVQEIEHYDDGDTLNTYYEDTLMAIDYVYKPLYQGLRDYSGSMLSYHLKSTILNKFGRAVPQYNKLHGSTHLIDLRILHELAQERQNDLCICAGAHHIERVSSMLPALGFRLHESVGLRSKECVQYYQQYLQVPAVNFDKVLPKVPQKKVYHSMIRARAQCAMRQLFSSDAHRCMRASRVATAVTLLTGLLSTVSCAGY
ncbi:MAG: hypothetical protein WD055_06005 [Candidatus Dependentiae bacterium]